MPQNNPLLYSAPPRLPGINRGVLPGVYGAIANAYMGTLGPATGTAQFAAQRGSLLDAMKQAQQRDAQAASGRGLVGSEFEIAQGGRRTSALAEGLRSAAAGSAQQQSLDRQRYLQQLLGAAGMQEGQYQFTKGIDEQRRNALMQILASMGGGVGEVLASKFA